MKTATKIVLSALVLFTVFVWTSIVRSPENNGVEIYHFDIGQGDAALIQRGNYQILIDGGPDDTILSKLGEVMPLVDKNIEVVILSHPHADHLVGINQVIERFTVEKVYSTGVVHTSNEYLEFLENINNKNIELIVPNIGFQFEPYENANMQFFWPGERYREKSIENLNNSSIVNKFCYFEECVLFTGDIETDEQAEVFKALTEKDLNLEAKYLKVAHHGSSNGTNQIFLDKVIPDVAVISAGEDNQFGHPHKSTIDLLLENEIEIKRTDRDGDVKIELGITN